MPSKRASRSMGKSVLTVASVALLFAACGRSHGLSALDAAVSPDTRDSAKDGGIGLVLFLDAPRDAYIPCGNGIFDSGEACDDGNTASGDGCSADCRTVEPGWRCQEAGRACSPVCGDGIRAGSEICDDGNSTSGDGCSHICLSEPGWDCSSGVCVRSWLDGGLDSANGPLVCGDGITSGAEECDDGPLNNDTSYGGCTTHCTLGPYCGDGRVEQGEWCDLGDLNGKPIYLSNVTDAGTSRVIEDPRGIVWCDSNCRTEFGLCQICPGLGCIFCD